MSPESAEPGSEVRTLATFPVGASPTLVTAPVTTSLTGACEHTPECGA